MLPLSVPAPSLDPEPRAVLSAQCPVPWSQGSQPDVSLLAPKVTAPQGRAECQAQEALRATVLASALEVFSYPCNQSARLGTVPLREPPPADLNCPLALPGEGEARLGGLERCTAPPKSQTACPYTPRLRLGEL